MTANLDRLYRVTLAGILLDDDYPGGAQSTADLPGWFDGPPVRSGVTAWAGQDGGSASAGLAGPRVVTVVGSCHDANAAAVVAFRDQLAAIPLTQAVDLVVESVRSGSTTSARVWLTRAVEVEWQTERRFVYTIEVTAPDPLKYGAAIVDLLAVPTGASVGTGRAWPRVWVRSWGVTGSSDTESVAVPNAGTATYWPTVRIDGPVTNPRLFTTSGDTIRIVRDVSAGQWVDVDCAARRVTLNGQVSLRNAVEASGAWLAVQPGGSAIGWTADGAGESASVTILAYEGAWW